MKIVIDIQEAKLKALQKGEKQGVGLGTLERAVLDGTPLTLNLLADALMEERIRGKLYSDTIFEKDIISDVKCRLTVGIRDHRPCYCGAELREVWRESEGVRDEDSN